MTLDCTQGDLDALPTQLLTQTHRDELIGMTDSLDDARRAITTALATVFNTWVTVGMDVEGYHCCVLDDLLTRTHTAMQNAITLTGASCEALAWMLGSEEP